MYRQGDLLFVHVLPNSMPSAEREDNPYLDKVIIAFGEKSGHMHQIKSRQAEILKGGSGRRYLRAEEDVIVTHEEHAPMKLPAGDYEIVQQQELHGDHARAVSD